MKKRAGGYFGLHFDFHAGKDCVDIGIDTTNEMLGDMLDAVKPDFVQCDCKGHAGYASYKTKLGNQAPSIAADALIIWREETKKRGIPLIMHYSGVFDALAAELHPEWAAVNEDGTPSKDKMSTAGSYADGLLIPQLVELALDYGVDGVWVDGECWAVVTDFSPGVIEAFKEESGYREIGKETESPSRMGLREYNRKLFKRYLDYYANEIHKKAPDFQIASNWAFSSHIPEKVCADVDYLSGDFSPSNSYNSARFEARCLCRQDLPWDLMSWGFYHSWDSSMSPSTTKSDVQLSREAACVLSLGGGWQVYNTQKRNGAIKLWHKNHLARAAEFCRERQEFLEGAVPLPSPAILYSASNYYAKTDSLFIAGGQPQIHGAVRAVLDGGRPADILYEYHLLEGIEKRRTVILPECDSVSGEMIEYIKKHIVGGGSVIITGVKTCKIFEEELGVLIGNISSRTGYIEYASYLSGQNGAYADVTVKDAEIIAYMYPDDDNSSPKSAGATVRRTANGGVAAGIYADVFERYSKAVDFTAARLIGDIYDICEPEPLAVISGGVKAVDIIPSRKDGKINISLINTAGIYSENIVQTYDEIPPLYDLSVKIRSPRPSSVMLQPENRPAKYGYDGQYITVTVEKLDINTIIVVE